MPERGRRRGYFGGSPMARIPLDASDEEAWSEARSGRIQLNKAVGKRRAGLIPSAKRLMCATSVVEKKAERSLHMTVWSFQARTTPGR